MALQVWSLLSHLAVFFGQFRIVQLNGKVDHEAASVAVHTPLRRTDRIQN